MLAAEVNAMQSTPDYQAIRARIRQQRLRLGLRQERLAELVEVSPAYISRLETGKDNPSLQMLYRFAAVFECSVNDFLMEGALNSSDHLLGEIVSRARGARPEQRKKILQIMDLVLDNSVPAPEEPQP